MILQTWPVDWFCGVFYFPRVRTFSDIAGRLVQHMLPLRRDVRTQKIPREDRTPGHLKTGVWRKRTGTSAAVVLPQRLVGTGGSLCRVQSQGRYRLKDAGRVSQDETVQVVETAKADPEDGWRHLPARLPLGVLWSGDWRYRKRRRGEEAQGWSKRDLSTRQSRWFLCGAPVAASGRVG